MTETIPMLYQGTRHEHTPTSLLVELQELIECDPDAAYAEAWNIVVGALLPRKADAETALVLLATACAVHLLPGNTGHRDDASGFSRASSSRAPTRSSPTTRMEAPRC